jgi:hypothetical protein
MGTRFGQTLIAAARFVDTGVQPDRSSRDNIVKNADGSVELYFGPKAPKGKPERTGSRPSPAKAGLRTFVSTARRSVTSTAAGCCRMSKK